MRVGVSTLGCRLNQAESDGLEAELTAGGHEIVAQAEAAQIWIVNTCTITHRADADARQLVRRLARANPDVQMVVTGCWAQSDPRAAADLPQTAMVVGNGDKRRIVELLDRVQVQRHEPWVALSSLRRRRSLQPVLATKPLRTRPFLKVQDGCNYNCAFCIVPQVRGRSASLSVDDVHDALGRWVDAGVPEVVLTGAHLGTWGHDLRPRRRLADLVETLVSRAGGTRLRLSSIDPHEVDDDLMSLMAEHPRTLCRHLHLPVQSGDNDVLKRMRRAHTVERFAELCQTLVERLPGVAIGTDVVVGFPGEDETAFGRTEALLCGQPLAYHHVFAYSRRTGTAAVHMPGQISSEVKAERSRRLRKLSHAQARAFARQFHGQTLDAIIEKRRNSTDLVAITDNFLRLPFSGDKRWLKQRTAVAIDAGGSASPVEVTLGVADS